MNLSEKIKIFRIQHKLSQKELGEKVGSDAKQICRYETGAYKPSIDTLKRLADVLGVTTDFLLSDKKETKKEIGINDEELFMYCQAIDKMTAEVRNAVKFILNSVVMTAKKENYFSK